MLSSIPGLPGERTTPFRIEERARGVVQQLLAVWEQFAALECEALSGVPVRECLFALVTHAREAAVGVDEETEFFSARDPCVLPGVPGPVWE